MIEFDTTMRVAVFGDWHEDADYASRAIEAVADQVDVMLHVGDFGAFRGGDYIERVSAACEQVGKVLIFVDGNHEDHAYLRSFEVDPEDGFRHLTPWVWYAPRGHRWQFSGVRFLALGGAPSVNASLRLSDPSWSPTEAITTAEFMQTAMGGKADVMIAHDCPDGVPLKHSLDNRNVPESDMAICIGHRKMMREVVEEVSPAMYFHGHFHYCGERDVTLENGKETTVVALSLNGGPLEENRYVLDLADLQ